MTMEKMNRGKAPDPDGLPIEIEEIYLANIQLFIKLQNKYLKRRFAPSAWKKVSFPLFNKDIKPKQDLSSYRPICLLDSWGKLLDKLIIQRFQYHLYRSGNMCSSQYGFTP